MMKPYYWLFWALWPCIGVVQAQPAAGTQLQLTPVVGKHLLILEQPVPTPTGDTVVLEALRFYLGHFTFWHKGQLVFDAGAKYQLIDLENAASQVFQWPFTTPFDSLSFVLGVDSTTTAEGAMGGDLDPTKGMFWTWQSGYIHAKAEGSFVPKQGPSKAFQLHLGGYLRPYVAVQRIGLPFKKQNDTLQWDLWPLLRQVNWTNGGTNIMSPGKEAVRLSKVWAAGFEHH